jgi:hypothetical protein
MFLSLTNSESPIKSEMVGWARLIVAREKRIMLSEIWLESLQLRGDLDDPKIKVRKAHHILY